MKRSGPTPIPNKKYKMESCQNDRKERREWFGKGEVQGCRLTVVVPHRFIK